VHWSISSVTNNPNLAKALLEGPYAKDALVPASKWLDSKAPVAPLVRTNQQDSLINISWTHNNAKDVFRWVVYYQYGNHWSYRIVNRDDRSMQLSVLQGKNKLNVVAVTAVDRAGNESVRTEVNLNVTANLPRR